MKRSLVMLLVMVGFVLVSCSPIKNKEITYEVKGTAPSAGVSYTNASGLLVSSNVDLPFSITFDTFGYDTATLAAACSSHDAEYPFLSVFIYVDGELYNGDTKKGDGYLSISTTAK